MNLHLPIDDFLEECASLLTKHSSLVVTAAPGAGKTTRLPAYLAKKYSGKILVLEPRRMAALGAAHRVAEEQGWDLGNEVGYQVRFQNKTQAQTKLIFLTEALLSRKIKEDPELKGIDVVVLDEFHERSIHVDLALSMLKELQELGSPIKIVVMSATLEAQKISQFLNHAPIIEVPGKLFPLKINYATRPQLLTAQQELFVSIFETLKKAIEESSQDILIFLPGVSEIEGLRRYIEDFCKSKNLEVLTLHGSLPLEEQQRALKRQPHRRVLLSTNIAESSVTIDGVNCVIDTGLAKIVKHDFKTDFSRLEMGRISIASATQRAGRAARQTPGVCYRLWTKLDEASMLPHEVPEILRIDLSDALLFLAAQGITQFETFSWFEKPTPLALKNAVQSLIRLEALEESGKITSIGHELLRFPLPLRLARIALAAKTGQEKLIAAALSALLQEKDFLLKKELLQFKDTEFSDLLFRLNILLKGPRGFERSLSKAAYETTKQAMSQISHLLQCKEKINLDDDTLNAAVLRLLFVSYADRLSRFRGSEQRALMATGRGVKLAPQSLCRGSEFFFSLDGVDSQQSQETLISMAHPVSKDEIVKSLAGKIVREKSIFFDEERQGFYSQTKSKYQQLVLDESAPAPAASEDLAQALPQLLLERLTWTLKENEGLAHLVEKLLFLQHHQMLLSEEQREQLQDIFSDEGISRDHLLRAFEAASLGHSKLTAVVQSDLSYFVMQELPQGIQVLLRDLPDKIQVPSGTWARVHYPADRHPYMEIRIQEIFGWTTSPRVLKNLSVTLHLLAPNFRPVQVTSDLTSFWQNGYSEVRKELRLKYPKHQWPEDPRDGIAEAKGRHRR